MADAYIDFDETGTYGDYAVDQITLLVTGRLRDLDPALLYAVMALRSATENVAAQLRGARAADGGLHAEVASREAPVAEARDALNRFARHLESHRAGTVPYLAFFVEPPATLAGRSPSRLVAALDHVVGTLAEQHTAVREAAFWLSELTVARDRLRATLITARPATTRVTPGLAAAREHWLVVYSAAKHLVAAALALSGAPFGLEAVFDDLAEVHRTVGVHDDAQAAAAPAG